MQATIARFLENFCMCRKCGESTILPFSRVAGLNKRIILIKERQTNQPKGVIMTAYANLRNVLATMYAANYFADDADVSNDLIDAYTYAQFDLEDWVMDTDRSKAGDFTSWADRFFKYVERAARTASKGDEEFIAAVLADIRDHWGE